MIISDSPITLQLTASDATLLAWCVAASIAAHVLLLTVLPDWRDVKETPPIPLQVELLKPPEIEPPKLLPMEPPPPQKVKPAPQQREVKPIEPPRTAPILVASPEAPPSPAAPVVPEQKPAPPPELPRAQAPVAAPAPPAPPAPATSLTPPRSDAAYLNNPRPAYPLAARRRGDQGTVLLRVLVTSDGLAASVTLEKTSGHSSLDDAALTAVKTWRFVPARQGGQAVEAPYVVPIVFKVE